MHVRAKSNVTSWQVFCVPYFNMWNLWRTFVFFLSTMACHDRCVDSGVDEQHLFYYSSLFGSRGIYLRWSDAMRYVLQVRCLTQAPFLLQVGCQVSIHTSRIILVDDIFCPGGAGRGHVWISTFKTRALLIRSVTCRSLKCILYLKCDTRDASEVSKH